MSFSGGHQYAFVIQTRSTRETSWSWITDFGDRDHPVIGRGVVDDAVGSPRVFGRATFRAYLDDLIAEAPTAVDYFLLDDDDDTAWRILVWDVPATGYDQRSTVPPAGDRTRLQYALALAIEGGEPHHMSTWPGAEVRKNLLVRAAAQDGKAPRVTDVAPLT
ncbi:hypothetical protein ABZ897_43210 [Nonomuraea sp. NPDC046802]|uniref:hypothetical protein n=1 Tax=Nonomuraea sp. NPDC046802 TaxID=3154919 RepID=UPI00340788A1